MKITIPLAMVRCRLDGSLDSANVRYVPASQFDLWQHFMSSQHGRSVEVDEVSAWLPESPEILKSQIDLERLEPVVRVRFERDAASGSVPVVRFLSYETYPEARAALLGHFDERCQASLEETPGYFVANEAPQDLDSFKAA